MVMGGPFYTNKLLSMIMFLNALNKNFNDYLKINTIKELKWKLEKMMGSLFDKDLNLYRFKFIESVPQEVIDNVASFDFRPHILGAFASGIDISTVVIESSYKVKSTRISPNPRRSYFYVIKKTNDGRFIM